MSFIRTRKTKGTSYSMMLLFFSRTYRSKKLTIIYKTKFTQHNVCPEYASHSLHTDKTPQRRGIVQWWPYLQMVRRLPLQSCLLIQTKLTPAGAFPKKNYLSGRFPWQSSLSERYIFQAYNCQEIRSCLHLMQ